MVDGYDVVVVGAGNAAFSAALAARESVERVLVLEKAPREWVGGNSYFTAGAFRTTFESLEDLRPLLDEVSEEELARTEAPPYTEEDFMADMRRLTQGRCDEKLTSVLVDEATEIVRWLREKGIRWRLMYDRQSFEIDGKRRQGLDGATRRRRDGEWHRGPLRTRRIQSATRRYGSRNRGDGEEPHRARGY
jgi:tricarballylate dehydrogenase